MTRYHEVYAAWNSNPEEFWAKAAQDISWYKLWDNVFDPYMGEYGRWFAGAECNTAYNCLDRHIEGGRGDQAGLSTIARSQIPSRRSRTRNCCIRSRHSRKSWQTVALLKVIA